WCRASQCGSVRRAIMCRPAHEAPGAPYADTRLFVPREGVMLNLEQWARVRARTNCQLRRGAWYRVVELAPLDVVLEVNRRPLRVPRPFVQVIPIRPRLWSVVARLRNAAAPPQDWGPRYGVCPRCASRAPLLLIAGVLHRREIALHLAILVAIDLLQLELVLLSRGHQLLHAVFVGRSRGQLGVQGLVDLALPRAHRLALLLEPLLGGLHLPCLVVAQTQRRAHMLVPALPDLATQLLRLRRVRVGERARVALLLRPERRRQREHEHPPEPPHHPPRD